MKRKIFCLLCCVLMVCSLMVGCGKETNDVKDEIVLEFAQWFEPELPDGVLREMMNRFEAENPGIKVELLSAPFSNNQEIMISGAATGTLADVVGLDGNWMYDFVKQGALANMSELMTAASYDDSQLSAQIQVDGGTYMIPMINFIYPLFVNNEILEQAGLSDVPTTREEFVEYAKAAAKTGDNVAGYCLALNLENPNVNDCILSWIWMNGDTFIEDGKANVNTDAVKSVLEMMKELQDADALTPGAASMQSQDKVEEFSNGRLGIMVDSLAHVAQIRMTNPDLDFSVGAIPVAEGYTGQCGMSYDAWGLGIAENCEHKEAAWKLVEFLMSEDVNRDLASYASALPGNKNVEPDFSKADPLFEDAYEVYKECYLINEFTGVPQAMELRRVFCMYTQEYLDGDCSVDEALGKIQAEWETILKEAE